VSFGGQQRITCFDLLTGSDQNLADLAIAIGLHSDF